MKTTNNATTTNNQIEIIENGSVKLNGEYAKYDNLLEVLSPVEEYETKDSGQLALFPYDNGFIEVLLDGSFESGQEANFTTASFDEIMEVYGILN